MHYRLHFCCLFNDAVSSSLYIVPNGKVIVNDDLRKAFKEVDVAKFWVLSQRLSGIIEDKHDSLCSIRGSKGVPPNRRQTRYRLN